MNEHAGKSTFIPYRRSDIIDMCLQDGKLSDDDKDLFRVFCRILIAYYHFAFHERLMRLKDYFIPIDPDSIYKPFKQYHEKDDPDKVKAFFDDFEYILKKANYVCLDDEDVRQSFADKSLIQLNFQMDFNAMEHYVLYYRGKRQETAKVTVLPLYKKEITFDVFDRVVLMLKFKDEDYFRQKRLDPDKLNFKPGKTYLYYYKNIPVNDLEVLFPNVKVRMTLKDQLMFWVPAVGAGIGSLSKVSTNILILIGFIFFLIGLPEIAEKIGAEITDDTIQKVIYPVLVASFSVLLVLGGFAVKQYLNYKNKFIHFMKMITDTLFFRSISINMGVFQTLIDAAEEEECKEAILSYYHLLTSNTPLTENELDKKIEDWFEEKFQTKLNFDVKDALQKLRQLQAEFQDCADDEAIRTKHPLLIKDKDNRYTVPRLHKAIIIFDTIWDNIFHYNQNTEFAEEE